MTTENLNLLPKNKLKFSEKYSDASDVVLFHGDRLDFMKSLPSKSVKLVITSPPYNIGKAYEKRKDLDLYLAEQEESFKECVRILDDQGSLCWQVGNHIAKDGEVFPLDTLLYPIGKKFGLKLRNRIIWHFGHGLHSTYRFSGRHESILWFTKPRQKILVRDLRLSAVMWNVVRNYSFSTDTMKNRRVGNGVCRRARLKSVKTNLMR